MDPCLDFSKYWSCQFSLNSMSVTDRQTAGGMPAPELAKLLWKVYMRYEGLNSQYTNAARVLRVNLTYKMQKHPCRLINQIQLQGLGS